MNVERKSLIELYISANGKIVNQELAEMIVEDLPLTGENFTLEEAEKIRSSEHLEDIPLPEFYLVLNYMYSEHFRTFQSIGLTDTSFFASLAKDWFTSLDYSPDKTFNFFMH